LFEDRLSRSVANLQNSDEGPAILLLDIDRFKTINDTLGHTYGDLLLKAVAERLKTCIREQDKDTLAHWGGDEFLILLSQTEGVKDIAKVAQKILAALKPTFQIGNQELHITASLGIAIYPHDGLDAEALIKNADIALYRAKEGGRNNVQFYTPTMSADASQLFVVERYLYRALERGEFEIHYQPQISLHGCEIIGMEALLRWNNPELGKISPKTFIPLIEENGLIIPIGEWVLQTACAQSQAWQAAGLPPISVSVNLSVNQFRQPNLVETIAQILAETGLDPQWLDLEITESIAIQDVEFTRSLMGRLREMSVGLSMDDFGTGYSSLSYLTRFPINTLKIDQSFVHNLDGDAKGTEIITAVIALAQAFKLNVIAEGVETREQLEFLRDNGCEAIQGYLISRPLPADQATVFLKSLWHTQREAFLPPSFRTPPLIVPADSTTAVA
jgi:diguanylate cyclase (GGDEF)-like protein